jgi:thiamine pyrophosphate-dependent acetolactate synthase large subunit-like protein
MSKSKKSSVDRRGFLKSAAAGAAALTGPSLALKAQAPPPEPQQDGGRGRGGRGARNGGGNQGTVAREDGTARPTASGRVIEHPGSDYLVDVIQALGIEYVAFNPGSSFEGLHESLINYGGNDKPECITCCHEESAVAMAHGYGKIENKPMLALLHGTIGIQHGAMAIYNAYGDRAPVLMMAGSGDTAVPAHDAVDMAAMCRDFVKWDHQPETLQQYSQAAIRAYKLCVTPPMAPVLLVINNHIQQDPIPANGVPVPKLVLPQMPSADLAMVREIAKGLVNAENPRINAGKMARNQEAISQLVELAELVGASVNGVGERVNFPSRHPLSGNGTGQPDFILNLEAGGGGGGGGGRGGAGGGATAKTYTISAAEFLATHNYNINRNSPGGDVVIDADAQTTLPALIEEVKKQLTGDRKRAAEDRAQKHGAANLAAKRAAIERLNNGWNASPISLGRLTAELWPLIEKEDWSLVSPQGFIGNGPSTLWDMKKTYHYIGGQGAGGMGYGAPAAVGAALANRKYGRLSVNIQTDGDLNYAPGVLWTAVHHKVPLLTIMHNNRGYHQEVMFIEQQCSLRNRGAERAHIGTKLIDPNINYATMAKAYGMDSQGPIDDPKDLAAALKWGVDRVKKGEPVMIDVVTQPRA